VRITVHKLQDGQGTRTIGPHRMLEVVRGCLERCASLLHFSLRPEGASEGRVGLADIARKRGRWNAGLQHGQGSGGVGRSLSLPARAR